VTLYVKNYENRPMFHRVSQKNKSATFLLRNGVVFDALQQCCKAIAVRGPSQKFPASTY